MICNKSAFSMFKGVKEENPNLRKPQYQEHIYKLWKRSPENPNNI